MNVSELEACLFDRDCGAGQLCYVNVSWAPKEFDGTGFCQCNSFYGWQGETCEEFSATTYVLAVEAAVTGLVALFFGLWGVLDVLKAFKYLNRNLNAGVITLCATTVALLAHFAWRLLFLLSTISPAENNAFVNDKVDAEKYTTYSVIQRPILFLEQVLVVIACLHVSVMWVELAYRAKNMKTRMIQSVTHYRIGVYVTEIIFAAAMAVIAVLGRPDLAAVVAMPVLFLLFVSFSLGRIRMVHVLQSAISLATGSSDGVYNQNTSSRAASGETGKEKTAVDRTRRTMVVIKKVSLHVILAILGVIASGVLYFILNSRSNTVYGKFSWLSIVSELLSIFLLYALLSIFYYTHRSTTKLVRRSQSVETSESSRSKNDVSFTQTNTFSPQGSSTQLNNNFTAALSAYTPSDSFDGDQI